MERKLTRLVRALERAFGSPKKSRGNVLDSLVATILSQSTSSTNSSRAFASLRKRFPKWGSALRAGARGVERAIRSGGLSKQKSRSICAILRRLRAEKKKLSLEFLRSLDDEEAFAYFVSLPGVGVKTAACVMLFSMGRDVFPVDTHVHRTMGRLGVSGGRSPEETFRLVSSSIPRGKAMSLHLNMVRLGREYCRSSSPLCGECPVRRLCPSAGKTASKGGKLGLAAAALLVGCVTPIYDQSSGESERARCFSLPGVTTVASYEVKEKGLWKKRSQSVSVGGPLFEMGVHEGGKYRDLSVAKPVFHAGWGNLEGLEVRKVSVFPAVIYERESEPSGTGGTFSRKRLSVPVALLGIRKDNYGPGYLRVDFPWPLGRYTRGSQRGPEHWERTHHLYPFYSYRRIRHGGNETVTASTLLTHYVREDEPDRVTFKLLGGLCGYRREGRKRVYTLFWVFRWRRL